MSRARGMRGARKMRAFRKERVASVTSEEDWETVLRRAGDRLLLVEFTAPWSSHCKSMAPFLTALSQQPEFGTVEFMRADIEACPALGVKHSILSAPTYHFYRGGVLVESFSGAVPQKLLELLAKHKDPAGTRASSWKLVALTGLLVTGVALALRGGRPSQREEAVTAPATAAAEQPAASGAGTGEEEEAPPVRQGPAAKPASAPSRGATHAPGN